MVDHPVATGDEYSVKDLNRETWPDFERFFERYNGVQNGCWCMYYHRTGGTPGRTPEEKNQRNREDKKKLVMENKSRMVLIYHGSDVVASCQYGTRGELPRIDNGRNYKALGLSENEEKLWRITCFFVDREHRRKGLTSLAISEVLKRIKTLGGGIVEAYPVNNFKRYSIWFGTVDTFRRLGFKTIADLGISSVVMRKTI